MKILFFWLLSGLPLLAQTISIKENLGLTVNTVEDQILPVFSLDGQTLFLSEMATNGHYEIWFTQRDKAGNWLPKHKAEDMNPTTNASKYVFTQVENDLLLVNGWFKQTDDGWGQTKGLSWYVPSQKRFIKIDIPALQSQTKGRFVNAFLHRPTKVLLVSFAANERKDLYICQPQNPLAKWTELSWQAPIKLPTSLNSEFDDTTPFLDTDGKTLYFSSNRPGGYGGDDIYRSRRLDDTWTHWSSPENLGFRVNSNLSEIYYCVSPLRDYAYFVSYKHTHGSGDIFRIRTDSTQSPASKVPLVSQDTLLVPPPPAQPVEVTELNVKQ